MLKISLSAGHAGFGVTPGKRLPDGSMYEWDFNAAVVKEIIHLLAQYQDVAVVRLDDPTGKRDIPLKERVARSDAFVADVHIDIHANAFGSTWSAAGGIETFVSDLEHSYSFKLADTVQDNLIKATGLRNRGVKAADLHMVREPNAKAKILVEAGFMTNKIEAELLKTDAYRQKVAKAIVDALVQVYDLKERVPVKQVDTELEKARQFVKSEGIMSDLTRGNEPLTRDQFILIIYRMAQKGLIK